MQILEQKCSQIEAPSISAPTARKDSSFIFKSRLIFWTKITVAVLALAFLISIVKIEALVGVLKTAKWSYLGVAFLMIIPNILVQVRKWQYILKLANSSVSFATAFKSLLVGYPLGFVAYPRPGRPCYSRCASPGTPFQGSKSRTAGGDPLVNLAQIPPTQCAQLDARRHQPGVGHA